MKVTQWTRDALAMRRFKRRFEAMGYEEVDDGRGPLWELYRGYRTGHRIVAVVISPSGKSLFVKIEKANGG